MLTRRSNNRRALGDLTNHRPNLAHDVIKINRPINGKLSVEFGKNRLIHGQKKENLVPQVPKKRNVIYEMEAKKACLQKPKATTMDEELEDYNPGKERRECDSSMSIETGELQSETERDLHEPSEIEMEEAESPLPQIDKSDARNPLAVVEYVEEIYIFYRKSELVNCLPADYMSIQSDINPRMRAVLVDWLIEVHHKFKLMHETLFLAINLIDGYLSRQDITRNFLQLVGITGMLMACKYEEVMPPQVTEFTAITAGAYSRQDVLKMEKSMLNTLQFNLSVPTPFVFMRRFLKAAESDDKLEMLSFYLLELCMVEYQMLRFPPSLLSAAAIYTGRCKIRRNPPWNKTLRHHSTYTEDQLMECARLIEEIHNRSGEGKLSAVYRKYSISKYSCIATVMKHQQGNQKENLV